MNPKPITRIVAFVSAGVLAVATAEAQKFKAVVPASVTTPDTVQTRIGTLKFFDGLPDAETVQKVYDQLDFARGVEAFMAGMPATSVRALGIGFAEAGFPPNQGIGITETLTDARALFLTPNTTVVYAWAIIDVKDGPMVLQVPPGVLGILDDAYFRYITDLGLVGPDQGKGGKYLLLPPGHSEASPSEAAAGEGFFVLKPRTYSNVVIIRSFVQGGDVAGAVRNIKSSARMYPLSAAAKPPEQKFVNISGLKFNTVHANDFKFYEELNDVVQHEPADFVEPETVGLFAAIGIKKGKPFAPDARLKRTLTEAVAVGNATARAIIFAPRDPRTIVFPDRQWVTGFVKNSYAFEDGGERMLDARTLFLYYATGISPAMADPKPGQGAAYALTARDSQGRYVDGGKTYKITLPSPIPAGRFWSLTVYDNQTRSLLETDQALAGLDSTLPSLQKNADGSVTVWFAPKAPAGQEGNWVQTMPGKGWNAILRLYSPSQPWFDKSWRPGDFELVD